MTTKKDPVSRKTPVAAKPISEDEVDEALIETFPASDPPQWTLGTDHVVGQPSKSRKPRRSPWRS